MMWVLLHPRATQDHLGYIPTFLNEDDPRSAKEQFNANYVYGGFSPFTGFSLDLERMILTYPEDPPMPPLAFTQLHKELIFVYEHAWVLILQPDNSWEVARMD